MRFKTFLIGWHIFTIFLCQPFFGAELSKKELPPEVKAKIEELKNSTLSEDVKKLLERNKKEGLYIGSHFWDNKTNTFDYEGYMAWLKSRKTTSSLPSKKPVDIKGKIYILMSSSVPDVVWRNYICYVEHNHLRSKAIFVLRGFIGGIRNGIKPTLKYVQHLIKGWSCKGETSTTHSVEIDIDPRIFEKYGVSEVPAVIYNGKVSYGDWSLGYHLEKLKEGN
jgi:hypothetical protein